VLFPAHYSRRRGNPGRRFEQHRTAFVTLMRLNGKNHLLGRQPRILPAIAKPRGRNGATSRCSQDRRAHPSCRTVSPPTKSSKTPAARRCDRRDVRSLICRPHGQGCLISSAGRHLREQRVNPAITCGRSPVPISGFDRMNVLHVRGARMRCHKPVSPSEGPRIRTSGLCPTGAGSKSG